MAKTKFSDFQDYNNDGLVDKCVVDLPLKEDPCPPCIPNRHAFKVNWTKKTHLEAYLNEITCEYSIVYRSNYKDTGGTGQEQRDQEEITKRWEEYKERAVKELVDAFGKETSPENLALATQHAQYNEKYWYLSVVPNSRIKFLYTVPVDIINALSDALPDIEMPTAPKEVEFDVNELRLALIRVSKGLFLYSRYIKVFRAVDGGKVFFANTGGNFNLVPYAGKTGKLRQVIPTLLKFFWSRGWVLNGSLLPGFGKKDAERIVFGFNDDYTLKYISVWEYGCKHVAYTVNQGQMGGLKNRNPFNDPTAMSYLANVFEMESELISRVPRDWLEFLKGHTYPPITVNEVGAGEFDPLAEGSAIGQSLSAMDCLKDNFDREMTELGDEIMDEVFGLGDSIAYRFRDKLCGTEDSAKQDAEDVGWFSVYDPNTRKNRNVYAMAQEQAFAQLEADDQVFVELCARIFSLLNVSGGYQKMDELWAQVFDPLKICGLSALLTDVIKCLLGGLGIEEALAKMIESALKAMGVEDMGKLFVGLPEDKQREIAAVIERRLANGDVPGFNPEKMEIVPPWESDLAKDEASKSTAAGMADNPVPVDRGPAYSAPSTRRTLAQQFDTAVNDPYQGIDPNNILQLYVAALIDVYAGNLLDLADELNKFPGAPIIGYVIATLDCPRPPIFDPGLFDWLKDIQLPWCRNNKEITWPRLNMAPPMSLADIFKKLLEAAKEAFLNLIMNILIAIIVKACELLGDAICKALETVGALAAALPSLIAGTNSVENVIRDAICGPDAGELQVKETVETLLGSLGEGGAAMANQESVHNWTMGVSSMLTQRELAELFIGKAEDSTLGIVHEYTELEVPEFSEALPSPSDIQSLFSNIGDLFPPEFRRELMNIVNADDILADKPISPSLCATPEKLEEFKAARCALLEGRATKAQCDKLYADLKDQMLDDLEDMSTVFHKGIQAHIADQLPPLISGPGCHDGLFPFEPEEVTTARSRVQDQLYKEIKVAYTQDLIGNGPFPRQWGMVNLILSDINGLAYTTHQRKAYNRTNYVDFIEDGGDSDGGSGLGLGNMMGSLLGTQQGAFPVDVAGWLQDYIGHETYKPPEGEVFETNSTWRPSRKRKIAIEPNPLFGNQGREFTYVTLPGFKAGDLKTKFRDNAKGMPAAFTVTGVPANKKGLDAEYEAYGYGFDMYMSFSDLEVNSLDDSINYRDGDWTTLRIYERRNNAFSDIIAASDDSIDALFGMGEAMKEKLSGRDLGVATNLVTPQNSTSPHTAIVQEQISTEVKEIMNTLPAPEYGLSDAGTGTTPTNTYSPQLQRFASFIAMKNGLITGETTTGTSDTIVGMLPGLVDPHEYTINYFMESVFNTISMGAHRNPAFSYGAMPDDLSPLDIMYVNPSNYTDDDGDYHAGGDPYSIPSSEAMMGVSNAEYEGKETAKRIHYLDPATYGGSYAMPAIYIEPAANQGWLGFMDALVPEYDGCKPRRSDLIDFEDISQRVEDLYTKIPDDPRLRMGPDCRTEVPYARILDRASAAGIEGVVMIAIRAFASVHFIKAMATYSRFKPVFPDNFSGILSTYIIQEMETKFKESDSFLGLGMFKDERFWYAFLEQCVQIYDRKVTLGEVEPTPDVIESFLKLNDLQAVYDYPATGELRTAKRQDLRYLDKEVTDWMSLKRYRNLKNLHYVRNTETHAKNIMRYIVQEELNNLGKIFSDNLGSLGLTPDIEHIGKYLLSVESGMTAGSLLNLNQKLYLETPGVPRTEASELYTEGGEFARQDGSEYVGQYHVHVDDARGAIVMEGAFHKTEYHEELVSVSGYITVMGESGDPLGDVSELGEAAGVWSGTSPRGPQFKLEKLMRITPKVASEVPSDAPNIPSTMSGYVKPSDWFLYTRELPREVSDRNISDYYGNLEFVYDPQSDSGKPIGLKADTSIGVEYGLRLSFTPSPTESYILAESFIDTIDGPINNFEDFAASSRMLYCLANNLVDSADFKFVTEYVFPLNKLLAYAAIYNAQAFLPSIGEIVADYGGDLFNADSSPGRRVDGDGFYKDDDSVRGWEPYAKRMKFQQSANPVTWFAKGFDEWDREVLKNTTSKVRNLFLSYYRSRDFDWGKDSPDGVNNLLEQMRETIRPPAGAKFLPWWMKGRLRKRPLNKNGERCSSSDED